MAPRPTTLFELFGDFSELWPVSIISETVGEPLGGPDDPGVWLAKLDKGVTLAELRTGAIGSRVTIEATAAFSGARAGLTEGLPFVIRSMLDVEFRLLDTGPNHFVRLFAGVDEAGAAEVLLEGLPVEIRLPVGLVTPHPGLPDHPSGLTRVPVGAFAPGNPDDLEIVYENARPTTIKVHVRLHMTADGDFSIRTPMPISFGQCLFSGLPCKAVHDFALIPSPLLIPQTVDWIRCADTSPDLADLIGTEGGAFSVRAVHLDTEAGVIKGVADWLKFKADKTLPAEFVLDDLVVPFLGVPRHLTVGIRRGIVEPKDPAQVFAFDKAPVVVSFGRDPSFGVIVESLFARIPVEEDEEDEEDEGGVTLGGVSFSGSLFFAKRSTEDDGTESALSPRTVELSLGENLTPRLTYRRQFDPTTGLPVSGSGAGTLVNLLLHHEILDSSIDVMAMRLGLSISKLTDPEDDEDDEGNSGLRKFLDSGEATIDLFVSVQPSGEDDAAFKLRALDGETLKFGVEGIGWRQGESKLLGSGLPDLPSGVVMTIYDYEVILHEIGVLAEHGEAYLSFTMGLDFPLPSGFRGAVVLKRARFRLARESEAPFFLLDGVFARVKGPQMILEAGGYYSDRTEGDVRVREFGLSGKIELELGAAIYGLALDLLVGSVTSPTEKFRYFMLQAIYRSVIFGSLEVRNARLLFANNLQPKLGPADAEAGELRYYSWHKASNPLSVPGDRRLAVWRPRDGAWAAGIGAGVSLPSLGKLAEFNAFILIVDGEDENGALIAGEVNVISPEPIAYFALEWDGRTERFSLVAGVELTLSRFLEDPPEWSENIGKLTGTLFVTNDPVTFAIGRLSDQRSWLTLRFDVDFFVKSFLKLGFCFERSVGGDAGMGMLVSLEGGVDGGRKLQISYLARFGWIIATFSTGSSDGAATISIALALRIVLFRFLNLGLSMDAELRYIGNDPSRGEALLRFRFETPWFLPDVKWTLDCTFGESDPEGLDSASSPIRTASAIEGTELRNTPLHVSRFDPGDPAFDPDWDGTGVAPTFSIRQFSRSGAPEAERVARFEADASALPVAIDSTIAIDWSVAVNDQLSLAANVAAAAGSQSSGELDLTYDLVGIEVRRRPRFGADRAWRKLESRIELPPAFSDTEGVQLEGEYGPQQLSKAWDHDLRIGGENAPKRLLVNASTPFSFTTSSPTVDEETVSGNPDWPCCPPKDGDAPYPEHVVEFRDEPPGRRIVGDRTFTESGSHLRLLRPAIVRPSLVDQLTPPDSVVAFLATAVPGTILRAELDEDAAFCTLRIAWGRTLGVLELLGLDPGGDVVARVTRPLSASTGYEEIGLQGTGPIRRVEARLRLPPEQEIVVPSATSPPRRGIAIEIDRVSYVGLRDLLDAIRLVEACLGVENGGASAYSGSGKLFLLPNHDYEFAVTTRLSIAHPDKNPASADVTEHVYLRTKGLPGLNAVERPGEEIAPYVASAYPDGPGPLYREEPVTLAFTEDFVTATPLDKRPPGSSEEAVTLQRLQLLVAPDTALSPQTVRTATAPDWIVDNRTLGHAPVLETWTSILSVSRLDPVPRRSGDPFRIRLARLTQRSASSCMLPDPRDVTGSVLIAEPQGAPHPRKEGREIWPGSTAMTTIARAEGAPYVDRRGFVAVDRTAFDFATETGPGGAGDWSVSDARLRLSTGAERRYALLGETGWNHLTVRAGVRLDRAAGIAVALPQTSPGRGLLVLLERSGDALDLTIRGRAPGQGFVELARKPVPEAPPADATVSLIVHAFDDRLRATVLDTVVEVDRGDLREGRLALAGEGQASFDSLEVRGLDFHSFSFRTSRYISFSDHVGSFDGRVAEARPDDLGAGTTAATVAELWSATRADIEAAMAPEAEPVDRQTVFDRWVAGLGLPLRENVRALGLTRYLETPEAAMLLLESPEPLDFAREVSLAIARQDGTGGGGRRVLLPEELRSRRPRHPVILSVADIDGGLRVELDASALAETGGVRGAAVFAERRDREIAFLRGPLPDRPRPRFFVTAKLVNTMPLGGGSPLFPVLEQLKRLEPGTVALLSTAADRIIDVFSRPEEEPPLRFTLLQDGAARRLLIVPHDGASAQTFRSGRHTLSFALDRQRWSTTEPPDDTNRYRANASLVVSL